jgi:hypothetical protein
MGSGEFSYNRILQPFCWLNNVRKAFVSLKSMLYSTTTGKIFILRKPVTDDKRQQRNAHTYRIVDIGIEARLEEYHHGGCHKESCLFLKFPYDRVSILQDGNEQSHPERKAKQTLMMEDIEIGNLHMSRSFGHTLSETMTYQ